MIHLRVPTAHDGYSHQNPLRSESADEARVIDDRIFEIWEGHPRRHVVAAETDFIRKAERALAILREELAGCCEA